MENNKKLNDDNISVVYQKDLNDTNSFEATNKNTNKVFDFLIESEDVLNILTRAERSASRFIESHYSSEEYLKDKNINLSQYEINSDSLSYFFFRQKIIDTDNSLGLDLNSFKLDKLPYGCNIIETFDSIDYNELDIEYFNNLIKDFLDYYQALINNLDNRKLQFIDIINKLCIFQKEHINLFKIDDEFKGIFEDKLFLYFQSSIDFLKQSYIEDFLNIDVLNKIDTLHKKNIIFGGILWLNSDNYNLPPFPVPYQTLVNNFLAEAKNQPQNCIKYVSSFIEFYKSKVELLEFHKETYNIAIQQIKETSNSIKLKYMNLLQKVKEKTNGEYLNVSEWIKNRRLELGLTQKELSEITGISKSMIGHVENNIHLPSIENALVLSHFLKLDILPFARKLKKEMIFNFKKNLQITFQKKIQRLLTLNEEQTVEIDFSESISTVLRKRRQELGLSLRKLGELTGITNSGISSIENNVCNPSFENAVKLCNTLSIDRLKFLELLEKETVEDYIKRTQHAFESRFNTL